MDLQKLTISQIKKECTKQSFTKGQKYYEEKRITSLQINNDSISVVVNGTQLYCVLVRSFTNSTYYCTCPYDLEGFCKHIIAVQLHLSENFDKLIKIQKKQKSKIHNLLCDVSIKQLQEFLTFEMDHNNDLVDSFIDHFEMGTDDTRDYKSEIDSLYRQAVGSRNFAPYGYKVNFDKFIKIARIHEIKGNFVESARIYWELSESISDNMDLIDDSDAHYDYHFSDAIKCMVSSIKLQHLTSIQKQKYISLIATRHVKIDPDYFIEYYSDALEQICTNKDDYTFWKSIVEPHIQNIAFNDDLSEQYDEMDLILIQIHILEKLDDDSLDDFFTTCYKFDSKICLKYIEHLKKK